MDEARRNMPIHARSEYSVNVGSERRRSDSEVVAKRPRNIITLNPNERLIVRSPYLGGYT